MKQNKLFTITLCLLIQMFFNNNISRATDWSQYKESLLDEIIKDANENYKIHGKNGIGTTVDALKVNIQVQEYPKKMSKVSYNIVKLFFDTTIMEEKYRSLYTQEMNYIYKGNKFRFVFQDQLVDYFTKEIKIDGCVTLVVINGIYNSVDQVHTLLVNEFNSIPCAEKENINQSDNKDSNYYFIQALKYSESKKYDKAEECFTQAIAKDNNNCRAYANRGSLLYYKKKYAEALNDLNKAVQLNCANPMVYHYRASIYSVTNNRDKAKSDWETIIKLDPKDYDAYYNLCCYYSINNDINKSLEYLKKAVELGFSNKEVLMNDPDINNIRNTKEFIKLLKRIK